MQLSQNISPIDLVIPQTIQPTRLDSVLSSIIPNISRSRLTQWIKNGQVMVNNQVVKPKEKVYGGEHVLIYPSPNEEILAFSPKEINLDIIYEDDDILIINKPAGLVVHPGNGNWDNTLLNGLLFYCPQQANIPRAGIVHRLDKDTSGLMVVAKSLFAQTNLVAQLQSHQVTRVYKAIVIGHVAQQSGTISTNIGRDTKQRTKMTTLEFGGKQAITHYKVLEYFKQSSYVECNLETGRTHQIRVHFKSIKHPLLGDLTYGPKYALNNSKQESVIVKASNLLNRQALHALKLSFIHPSTKKQVTFSCDLANDIIEVLQLLREDAYTN
jgi:23S rRNA pseudouridine1911/1915/1917 synthase